MPAEAQGPYLYWKEYRDKRRTSRWFVRNLPGGKTRSTTLGRHPTVQEKADAITQAIAECRADVIEQPEAKGNGDPNQAVIADCIGYYTPRLIERMRKKMQPGDKRGESRIRDVEKMSKRVLVYFGTYTISEMTPHTQEAHTKQRGSDAMARRELNHLAAAINDYSRKRGGLRLLFSPTLPAPSQPREGCLTVEQAAALVRAAWRFRQKNRDGKPGRHTMRHVARAILVGLKTGTRATAICNAAPERAIGRGWVDLERGHYYRKAHGSSATNKRQPTVPLRPELLAHMRRWHRLGISRRSIIEKDGKPIRGFYRGFVHARDLAGLGKEITPHTLRHTCISWLLMAGISKDEVSEYCGVSVQIIDKHYKHYMEGHFDGVLNVRFGRRRKMA